MEFRFSENIEYSLIGSTILENMNTDINSKKHELFNEVSSSAVMCIATLFIDLEKRKKENSTFRLLKFPSEKWRQGRVTSLLALQRF